MFRDICVIILLILLQIPSNLRRQVTSISSVHLALLSKAKASFVTKQRGKEEQRKEMWKFLASYRVKGHRPHKRLPSLLIPTASSEDSQAPSGSIIPQYYQRISYYYCYYYYQRLKELTEDCYTHSYSLVQERLKINIREETKHIGQSSGEYQTWSF